MPDTMDESTRRAMVERYLRLRVHLNAGHAMQWMQREAREVGEDAEAVRELLWGSRGKGGVPEAVPASNPRAKPRARA